MIRDVMRFDFPIDKIEFKFELVGTSSINISVNDQPIEGYVIGKDLLGTTNNISIHYTKEDPADSSSYATFKELLINGGNFTDQIKDINYIVDKNKHKDGPDVIQNNLYFGYIGNLDIPIEQTDDQLKKAAWTIADKEFKPIKWPGIDGISRTKDFETVHKDAKYMFTGCQSMFTQKIIDVIDSMTLKELQIPLAIPTDRNTVEQWIGDSKRLNIKGLEKFDNFVPANGVTDCLRNFMNNDNVFMPKKMYYLNGELLREKHNEIKDVFADNITQNANVIFEYPSPWYSNEELDTKIAEAKELGCYIALDLTWLPIANGKIDLDLDGIDEVYVSMNKAWPIHDIRPAFRWSRQKSKDDLNLQMEYGAYTKVNVQVFMTLLKQFPIDYVYDKYKQDAELMCEKFNLEKTSVLWFTKRKDYSHDPDCLISDHYFLDDFVCIVHLLQYKDKYFW
jgi:hypothetical protein